jgi:hypothetical protein
VNRGALTECFPDKCQVAGWFVCLLEWQMMSILSLFPSHQKQSIFKGCRNQRFQKKEWIDFSLVARKKIIPFCFTKTKRKLG